MESDGLLTRKPGENDRRKSIVSITDKGIKLIQTHAPESNALFADLEVKFGKDRLEELLDLLEDLQAVDLEPQ
jgi:DNA-binding MarR family transcriptional regulator